MFERWKKHLVRKYYNDICNDIYNDICNDIYNDIAKKKFFFPQAYSFEQIMSNIRNWVDYAKQDRSRPDAIPLLDFLISTVREDMRTSTVSDLLYSAGRRSRDWREALFPFHDCFQNVQEMDIPFAGNTVISSIYDWEKISRASYDIQHNGFHSDLNYFSGGYYPELHLIAMENGLHHSCAAAAFHAEGTVKLEVYPLKQIFPIVTTDGVFWNINGEYGPVSRSVVDVRMAILFELARMKEDLSASPEP